MIHVINTNKVIDLNSETHFRFHKQIPQGVYPQRHDFCELMLLTKGKMIFTADDETFHLRADDLVFTRPGLTHSKAAAGECCHINLAFPTQTLAELLAYIKMADAFQQLTTAHTVPMVHITHSESVLLQTELQQLKSLPVAKPYLIRMHLRKVLLGVFTDYFLPKLKETNGDHWPMWFGELLEWLHDPVNFTATLDDMAVIVQRSREHICRTFQSVLGITSSAYLTALRLNYAANMLLHSDHRVIDIAFEAGFQSVGRFYAVFKREYNIPPLQYRKHHGRRD